MLQIRDGIQISDPIQMIEIGIVFWKRNIYLFTFTVCLPAFFSSIFFFFVLKYQTLQLNSL